MSIFRGLRYRIEAGIWFTGFSAVHGIFDRQLARRIPRREFKVLALCVYRYRNASTLLRCVSECAERDWEVRLWALDRIHPDLEPYSRGAGAGARSPLLNSLVAGTDLEGFDWVIIMDDDFALRRGTLASFLAIAEAAGISLAQPARAYGRYRTFPLINCNLLSAARLTSYVEIGPIVAVDKRWASKLLPFPVGFAMGWGLDLLWSDLRKQGLHTGVIDWVTIDHLSPVGKTYDNSPEKQRLVKMLQERGFNTLEELQETLATWRPWERRPPWNREQGTGNRE